MLYSSMPVVQLLPLAVAIAANNFAAAFALGAMGHVRLWPRVALVFGIVEFVVPLVGIVLGRQVAGLIGAVAEWLGPALLITLGAWVAASPLRQRSAKREARNVTTWPGLIALSFALSVDNVVIGLSLGLGDVDALTTAAVIAATAVVFAIAGMHLGRASSRAVETWAKVFSGVALIGIGVWLLTG
jgi:manganese efflux pump family protein